MHGCIQRYQLGLYQSGWLLYSDREPFSFRDLIQQKNALRSCYMGSIVWQKGGNSRIQTNGVVTVLYFGSHCPREKTALWGVFHCYSWLTCHAKCYQSKGCRNGSPTVCWEGNSWKCLTDIVRDYTRLFFIHCCFCFFFKILFIFREGEGGRETSMCGCLSHAPYWGPDPQPRHVP